MRVLIAEWKRCAARRTRIIHTVKLIKTTENNLLCVFSHYQRLYLSPTDGCRAVPIVRAIRVEAVVSSTLTVYR